MQDTSCGSGDAQAWQQVRQHASTNAGGDAELLRRHSPAGPCLKREARVRAAVASIPLTCEKSCSGGGGAEAGGWGGGWSVLARQQQPASAGQPRKGTVPDVRSNPPSPSLLLSGAFTQSRPLAPAHSPGAETWGRWRTRRARHHAWSCPGCRAWRRRPPDGLPADHCRCCW